MSQQTNECKVSIHRRTMVIIRRFSMNTRKLMQHNILKQGNHTPHYHKGTADISQNR